MYKRILHTLTLALALTGFCQSAPAAPDINIDEDVADEPAKAIAYRYWIDDNVNSKTTSAISGEEFTSNIDVSSLTVGVHVYHLQLQDQSGNWGTTQDITFYAGNIASDTKEDDTAPAITSYEYWFDDNFSEKVSQAYTQADISFDKDISGMASGKHTYYFVAYSSSGIATISGGFYLPDTSTGTDDEEQEVTSVVSYQYWIDNDRANAQTLPYTSDDITSNIDYTTIAGGAHLFNFRLRNSEGIWTRNYQFAFYVPETNNPEQAETQQPITGYRYGVNGKSTTKDLTEIDNIPSLDVDIAFPTSQDISNVESYDFITDNATSNVKVKRNYDLTYYIQFRNKLGEWGEPVFTDSVGADSTIRAAKDLTVQQTVGIRKLGKGDYDIVKFTIPESNGYYFGSSTSCQAMLIQDSKSLMTFTPEQMTGNTSTLLAPGTYFAVIYNQTEDGSVRLSNSANWVSDPTFSYADHNLSINCATNGATIYYTLDGTMPTRESATYTGAIAMSANTRVRALACIDGMADSYVQSYLVSDFDTQTCADPVPQYDGRTVTLATESKLADIYYTLDGTDPTTDSQLYNVDNGISVTEAGVVKALASADLMNPSNVVTFEVPSYYDGASKVSVRKAGNLAQAFEWCGGKPQQATLNVTGTINDTDASALAKMDNVRILDMSAASAENNTIGDRAFAGMNILSASLPSTLTTCGNELFAGCAKLAAVVWNSSAIIPANALDGINNPNLLLYVQAKSAAPSGIGNVVASGVAETITLSDAGENSEGNFYCPKAFTAQKITYTRNFEQKTEMGVCQGWETIVLPFNVTTMRHETNGNVAPFAKGEKGAKPFWLYELSPTGGFQRAANILANVPYIISMPNSEYYADDYILGGKVTFEGNNVTVSATTAQTVKNDSREFVPCYELTEASTGLYSLNVGKEYESYRPGSVFVENFQDVNPFEAYLKVTTNYSNAALSIFGDEETTGIDEIPTKQLAGLNAWVSGSTLYIQSDKARRVLVFSTMGVLVKAVNVEAGETATVNDLPSGIYIVNKKKVAIK